MLPQQYCLRWKYYHSNLQAMFSQLLDRGCFCDVTLACQGQLIRAHRVVLCACSTYFDTILTNYAAEKDPIIIMKDAKFSDIKCLIEFMYKGEINVEHASLASLLKTAEELKIKGLAEVSWREEETDTIPPEPEPHFTECLEAPPLPPQVVTDTLPRMPLLTPIPSPNNQENANAGLKRKRGRPPLDEEYDVFSASCRPKLTFVHGSVPPPPYSENSNVEDTPPIHPVVEVATTKEQTNRNDWVEQRVEEHPHEAEIEENRDDAVRFCGMLQQTEIKSEEEDPEDSDSPSDHGSSAGGFYLTPQEQEEWKDVIKMDAYLSKGRRPQFWEESFTKRVMEAIKSKNLEMKKAAQLLGVSYGTLYGRYRETYGCLKHPYRGPSMVSRYRDMWTDKGASDLIGMLNKTAINMPCPTDLTIKALPAKTTSQQIVTAQKL